MHVLPWLHVLTIVLVRQLIKYFMYALKDFEGLFYRDTDFFCFLKPSNLLVVCHLLTWEIGYRAGGPISD